MIYNFTQDTVYFKDINTELTLGYNIFYIAIGDVKWLKFGDPKYFDISKIF
jgi:hypothetical protein